jgi:transcriptional regulator with XRE-family HTH domain
MYISDAIREIIALRGSSQQSVAVKLGVKPPSIAVALHRGNMTARTLWKILNALDYDLVAVPRGTKLPPAARAIDPIGCGERATDDGVISRS